MFQTETIQDELSRTAKMLLDGGDAVTIEDAYAILGTFRLSVRVGDDVAGSATLQAALLTIVNTARRCFLGGVKVVGCRDADLLVHVNGCRTLRQAIIELQGEVSDDSGTSDPQIVIGDAETSTSSDFAMRATFEGWVGGVAPKTDQIRLRELQEFTPSGVLAGSLAVSEAFQFVRGKNPFAGRRSVGLSLWEPHSRGDWTAATDFGPELEILPSSLWLIGLGHLGQAYLWTLGLLPYANPGEVMLYLQDTDRLTTANDSTSPLTNEALVGRYKTRAMAEWCEARGFQTRIVERPFADNFRVAGDEPMMSLCGVDNALARASLEDAGFARVIEAGLGHGTEEYLAFQVHSFPGPKPAREIWRAGAVLPVKDASTDAEAYRDLEGRGMDQCGLTMLANRSVGASFVGTFTSTLVIGDILRMLVGGAAFGVIDGTLRRPEATDAIPSDIAPPVFNPGITLARPKRSIAEIPVDDLEEMLVEA
jgi:hypothetical protein